jgi:hypothetical protein
MKKSIALMIFLVCVTFISVASAGPVNLTFSSPGCSATFTCQNSVANVSWTTPSTSPNGTVNINMVMPNITVTSIVSGRPVVVTLSNCVQTSTTTTTPTATVPPAPVVLTPTPNSTPTTNPFPLGGKKGKE